MSTSKSYDDRTPYTEQMIKRMADEAEAGYDVEEMLERRRGGRPPTASRGERAGSPRGVKMTT